MQVTLALRLYEVVSAVCGTITLERRCYRHSYIDRPHGTAEMMVIPPAIGVILILIGIALFIADLHVISHGLLTVGGIVTLLAGGLALLGAGVPYSGVLLGALVVVAMLMGVCSSGYWVLCAPSEGARFSQARRG